MLASWQVETHAPLSHCDKLLKILRRFHPTLPRSAKKLLATSNEKLIVVNVQPGCYRHIGIANGIVYALETTKTRNFPSLLKLYVGIDGVKLTNSSDSEFWPIVGFLKDYSYFPSFVNLFWETRYYE